MITSIIKLLNRCSYAVTGLLCLAALAASSQMIGPNINVSRMSADKTEPAIAIDPTAPARMFIAANVQDGNGLFAAFSINGGSTWTPVDPLDRVIADGTDGLPEACCDASISATSDRYGNFFLVYLKTASPSGIVVLLSTNGGQSFSHVTTLAIGHVLGQPTVVAGCDSGCANSAVWVTYSDASLPGSPVIAQGALVTGLGTVLPFGAAEEVPASQDGNYGDITVGPDGQVLVAFQTTGTNNGPSLIYCATDPDGLGPVGFDFPVLVTSTGIGDMEAISPQPIRGIDAATGLAYDRGGGRVYLVYVNQATNSAPDTDVFVRRSDDDGATWSAPTRVNNDMTGRSQFLPRIACDPVTGFAAIAWLDARNDSGDSSPADRTPGANNDVQLYVAATLDGGLSWSPNFRVSSGVSAQAASMNWNNFGEYLAIAFQSGTIFPVWPDNSDSTGDSPDGATSTEIFTAAVTVSGSAMFRVWDAVISAEVCQPANGSVDPGEQVTVDVALQNNGSGDVFNLEVALLAEGGVLNPDGPQNYGYIGAGDPEVARPFNFIADGECGGMLMLTLDLRDGPFSFGTITFPMRLGTLFTNGQSFSNTSAILINDDAEATPYPSVINVSGLSSPVTNVTVTLHHLVHTFPGDVDVLLVSPAGQAVMLMSDAGGGHNVDVTLTFDDAGAPLPQILPLVSTRYAPHNFDDPFNPGDALPFPAPEGPYATTLAAFNGANPNGPWQLYVFDDAGDDDGQITGGWSLNFVSAQAVCCDPPPRLSIQTSGGFVYISWPGSAGDYVLEGRANLNPATPWVEVLESPVLDNGRYVVTLPASGTARFFRLTK